MRRRLRKAVGLKVDLQSLIGGVHRELLRRFDEEDREFINMQPSRMEKVLAGAAFRLANDALGTYTSIQLHKLLTQIPDHYIDDVMAGSIGNARSLGEAVHHALASYIGEMAVLKWETESKYVYR
jgi:hypothetical protein